MDSMESRDFCDRLAAVSDSEVLRDLKFSYCNTEKFNSSLNNITGNIELSVFHLIFIALTRILRSSIVFFS